MVLAKVRALFLDIDGVVNSEASFRYHHREHSLNRMPADYRSGYQWCPILTNNLRILFKDLPEDVKVVISSTWRLGHDTVESLQEIFTSRDVDASRVIGRTGRVDSARRGHEIQDWLNGHPEVTDFKIIDDDSDMEHLMDHLVKTEWRVGLTLIHVSEIVDYFKRTTV